MERIIQNAQKHRGVPLGPTLSPFDEERRKKPLGVVYSKESVVLR